MDDGNLEKGGEVELKDRCILDRRERLDGGNGFMEMKACTFTVCQPGRF